MTDRFDRLETDRVNLSGAKDLRSCFRRLDASLRSQLVLFRMRKEKLRMYTSRLLSSVLVICGLMAQNLAAQSASYNGLDLNMGNLSRLSHAKTRSISPENLTGEKGKAAWQPWELALKRLVTWARAGKFPLR